jgi:outer membrane autotransporter protein
LVLNIEQLNAIEGLTDNQKKAALALDKDYGLAVEDLFDIIDKLDTLPDTAAKKQALTSLSGHIFANVITLPALNISKDGILSRLKKSYFIPDDSLIKRNIWAQGYAADNKYKGDKNSPGDFTVLNSGVQAGFDTMKDDAQIFGLSVGFMNTNAKQNSDAVDITGYNIGGYGAFFFENNFELMLMLIGARQNYSASRKISYADIQRKTNSEFDGYSINMSAELGYDYYYKENVYFRPLLGIDYAYATTQEFTEDGAVSADLTVYSGSYNRLNSNLGFQINNGSDMRAKWYAQAKFNFLLAGRRGEFEGEFKNTSQPLEIVGIENDVLSVTIGAGILYDISKSWSAYANIDGTFSGSQSGLYGNIGVNYKFTTTYFDFYEK